MVYQCAMNSLNNTFQVLNSVFPGRFLALVGRVFANGLGDRDSIPGRVIPKTWKWYLMPPCLTLIIIRYLSRIKWSNPGKGVAPFPTPWCSSYLKGSLWVVLDYSRQFYLLYTHTMRILVAYRCKNYHHLTVKVSSLSHLLVFPLSLMGNVYLSITETWYIDRYV